MDSPMLSPRYASTRTKRRFKPRKHSEPTVISTAYQSGRSRQRPYERAQPADCRNNLTALSHSHNLYIVAYEDELHVFEPHYPSQQISNEASLVVNLPVTSSNLRGYLFADRGHAVNHLIVCRLGDREIALCSCDDGDVLGFYTDAFVREIRHPKPASQNKTWIAGDIQPFFHVNVRLSAWGLAVHEAARMIAISANTHAITVFTFGLVIDDDDNDKDNESATSDADSAPSSTSSEPEGDWVSRDVYAPGGWTFCGRDSPAEVHQSFLNRNRDICAVLDGHSTNIPTVSFCNSGEDPSGRYLLSADIHGQMMVWDVFHLLPLRVFKPDGQASIWGPLTIMGWSIQWLDRRSFRTAEPNKAFKPGTDFYAEVEDGNERCVLTLGGVDALEHPTEVWDPLKYIRDEDRAEHAPRPPYGSVQARYSTFSQQEEDGPPQSASNTSEHESDDDITTGGFFFNGTPSRISSTSNRQLSGGSFTVPGAFPKDADVGGSNIQDRSNSRWFSWSGEWPEAKNILVTSRQDLGIDKAPHCPILLSRPQSLCFFQSPEIERLDRAHPFIHLEDPLAQEVPIQWQDHFLNIDRMNLTVQIPELGIILAGSPKGRVAILTLHQVRNSHLSTTAKEPLYTMRLDAIVPFPKQERKGQRPAFSLAGIAAGPIQGQLDRPGQSHFDAARTWRVILLYRDDTVLTYEIWRKRENDDAVGGSGIGEICIG